jgi:hypothetical protein
LNTVNWGTLSGQGCKRKGPCTHLLALLVWSVEQKAVRLYRKGCGIGGVPRIMDDPHLLTVNVVPAACSMKIEITSHTTTAVQVSLYDGEAIERIAGRRQEGECSGKLHQAMPTPLRCIVFRTTSALPRAGTRTGNWAWAWASTAGTARLHIRKPRQLAVSQLRQLTILDGCIPRSVQ